MRNSIIQRPLVKQSKTFPDCIKSSVIQFSIMSVYVFTIQGEKGDMGVAGPIGPQGIPVSAVTEHNLTFPTMYKCIQMKKLTICNIFPPFIQGLVGPPGLKGNRVRL